MVFNNRGLEQPNATDITHGGGSLLFSEFSCPNSPVDDYSTYMYCTTCMLHALGHMPREHEVFDVMHAMRTSRRECE